MPWSAVRDCAAQSTALSGPSALLCSAVLSRGVASRQRCGGKASTNKPPSSTTATWARRLVPGQADPPPTPAGTLAAAYQYEAVKRQSNALRHARGSVGRGRHRRGELARSHLTRRRRHVLRVRRRTACASPSATPTPATQTRRRLTSKRPGPSLAPTLPNRQETDDVGPQRSPRRCTVLGPWRTTYASFRS